MSTVHAETCKCRPCQSNIYGQWIYDVGKTTAAGKWQLLVTSTFRPRLDVWRAGFPASTGTSSHFAHRLFAGLVGFVETELSTAVDYFCADQLGFVGGKFHQHFVLSAQGLDRYPRQQISAWLFKRAGFCRVLPVRYGAERYVGRFIASNHDAAYWDFRIGNAAASGELKVVGRQQVARSAELSRDHFYSTHRRL